MTVKSSQQISRVLVPDFDGPVSRTTGEHVVRVEGHCHYYICMTSENSHFSASSLVPELDTMLIEITGKQMGGVKCDCLAKERRSVCARLSECSQQSITCMNGNDFVAISFCGLVEHVSAWDNLICLLDFLAYFFFVLLTINLNKFSLLVGSYLLN